MKMQMWDFLFQTVVNQNLEMVVDAKLIRDHLGRPIHHGEYFRRSLIEIREFGLGDYQQVHGRARTIIGDYDHIVGFMEYLCG
jgi:hypothetical protein